MTNPEEKLAIRLIEKHSLKPPVDIFYLASLYAEVAETPFPSHISGDGISIGLGSTSTPQILINSSVQVETRKRFTLAHELGHVIIPWHTGTILSDDSDMLLAEYEYKEMEAEANRFAAELLMPTEWVINECNQLKTVESFFNSIINNSCTSRDAALIKIFNVIDKPITCIETDSYGKILKKLTPKKCISPSFDFLNKYLDENLIAQNIRTTFQYETFNLSDRIMHTWLFESANFVPSADGKEWRAILDEMVMAINCSTPKKLKQSINSTLASKYQRYKSALETQELCNTILMAFSGVSKFEGIDKDPMFKSYIHKRVTELLEKDRIK